MPNEAAADVVRRFYRLAESFTADPLRYTDVLHPEVVFTEYPNALSPKVRTRDFAAAMEGFAMGGKILKEQRFEIEGAITEGERSVVEARWTGTMATDAGPFKAGQRLAAHVCAVFELRDGLIYRQRNYDCYEPFT